MEWTDAEREAVAAQVPTGPLHHPACRCHGDGDPAASHLNLGVFDGAWYAPECVSSARAAHRVKAATVDRILAALAPHVAALVRAERDRLAAQHDTLVGEVAGLAETLRLRSDALNRVAAENECLRAKVARVEALAGEYGELERQEGYGGELWGTTAAAIRAALADRSEP